MSYDVFFEHFILDCYRVYTRIMMSSSSIENSTA